MNRRLKPLVERIRSLPSIWRTLIGALLLIGGAFGVLPILGFWMIPLGLLVLSIDFPWARRGYLSIIVWIRKWRDRRREKKS